MSIITRKAKKQHSCHACLDGIEVGDQYEVHKTILYDSDHDWIEFLHGNRCSACSAAKREPWLSFAGRAQEVAR